MEGERGGVSGCVGAGEAGGETAGCVLKAWVRGRWRASVSVPAPWRRSGR